MCTRRPGREQCLKYGKRAKAAAAAMVSAAAGDGDDDGARPRRRKAQPKRMGPTERPRHKARDAKYAQGKQWKRAEDGRDAGGRFATSSADALRRFLRDRKQTIAERKYAIYNKSLKQHARALLSVGRYMSGDEVDSGAESMDTESDSDGSADDVTMATPMLATTGGGSTTALLEPESSAESKKRRRVERGRKLQADVRQLDGDAESIEGAGRALKPSSIAGHVRKILGQVFTASDGNIENLVAIIRGLQQKLAKLGIHDASKEVDLNVAVIDAVRSLLLSVGDEQGRGGRLPTAVRNFVYNLCTACMPLDALEDPDLQLRVARHMGFGDAGAGSARVLATAAAAARGKQLDSAKSLIKECAEKSFNSKRRSDAVDISFARKYWRSDQCTRVETDRGDPVQCCKYDHTTGTHTELYPDRHPIRVYYGSIDEVYKRFTKSPMYIAWKADHPGQDISLKLFKKARCNCCRPPKKNDCADQILFSQENWRRAARKFRVRNDVFKVLDGEEPPPHLMGDPVPPRSRCRCKACQQRRALNGRDPFSTRDAFEKACIHDRVPDPERRANKRDLRPESVPKFWAPSCVNGACTCAHKCGVTESKDHDGTGEDYDRTDDHLWYYYCPTELALYGDRLVTWLQYTANPKEGERIEVQAVRGKYSKLLDIILHGQDYTFGRKREQRKRWGIRQWLQHKDKLHTAAHIRECKIYDLAGKKDRFVAYTDFAAQYKHWFQGNVVCQTYEHTNLDIFVVLHGATWVKGGKWKDEEGEEQEWWDMRCKTTVFAVPGKASGAKKDADAAFHVAVQDHIVKLMQKKYPELTMVTIFTDGCGGQYAGVNTFFDTAMFTSRHDGIRIVHVIAPRYGFKGPHDAINGCLKGGAKMDEKNGIVRIETSGGLWLWGYRHMQRTKARAKKPDDYVTTRIFEVDDIVWLYAVAHERTYNMICNAYEPEEAERATQAARAAREAPEEADLEVLNDVVAFTQMPPEHVVHITMRDAGKTSPCAGSAKLYCWVGLAKHDPRQLWARQSLGDCAACMSNPPALAGCTCNVATVGPWVNYSIIGNTGRRKTLQTEALAEMYAALAKLVVPGRFMLVIWSRAEEGSCMLEDAPLTQVCPMDLVEITRKAIMYEGNKKRKRRQGKRAPPPKMVGRDRVCVGDFVCKGRVLRYKRDLVWETPSEEVLASEHCDDYVEREFLLQQLVTGMPRRVLTANVDVDVKVKRGGGASVYTLLREAYDEAVMYGNLAHIGVPDR